MSWRTEHEINFIKGLGMGKFAIESTKVKSSSRAKLLKGYLRGTALRNDWGEIDREIAINCAVEELRQLG